MNDLEREVLELYIQIGAQLESAFRALNERFKDAEADLQQMQIPRKVR